MPTSRELRTQITADGHLKMWLEDVEIAAPAAGEAVVQIEAAPLNPSDIVLLIGPADLSTLRETGTRERPAVEAVVPQRALATLAGRLDQALPAGNEGAGTVITAGSGAEHLVGRRVGIRVATGSYAQYRVVRAADCVVLPEGTAARDGAAAFINPLTALGMVETLRREGHKALVHTAAASNLGQMLNRVCQADGVPLVNIVRSPAQAELLRGQGATHVLDSSAAGFDQALLDALAETGATLAFDAIGGGRMASTILAAMEQVQSRSLKAYNRYGSPVHKQVYVYGMLDTSPRILDGWYGMAWGVGGWLLTWFLAKLPPADLKRLRDRVAAELTTTFASHYTQAIGLAEALSPEVIRAYARHATGEKYLLEPQR